MGSKGNILGSRNAFFIGGQWVKPASDRRFTLALYMDSPCDASASWLLDSGSDCRQYIRPFDASVDAGPDDIRSQEPRNFVGV